VCTRGRPVFESVKTKTFTHTAHVVTAGLFFALYVIVVNDCICLNPRILLVLENGDEVVLVEDKMGPLTAEDTFVVDFAVLDDAGRNVQMDLIFRGLPEGAPGADVAGRIKNIKKGHDGPRGFRTLRTCLQEYTTFNSHVAPPCVAVGSTELTGLTPSATVHLQHLVLSEDKVSKVVYNDEKDVNGQIVNQNKKDPCLKNVNQAPITPREASPKAHVSPMQQLIAAIGAASAAALAVPGEVLFEGCGRVARRAGNRAHDMSKKKDFWHHIRYDADQERGRPQTMSHHGRFTGEFWMTKEKVPTKDVFFHCSTILSQALAMCVIFRFRLQPDFLSLIENQASTVLRDLHIPTNGVVMGVETDPRHPHLIRMFIEHRNEILDDMVVCECKAADLARTVCVQEIYDSGSQFWYRVVLHFPDGTQQQAVLQIDASRIEESSMRERTTYVEDASTRFPISPFSSCLSGQQLSVEHRIFAFTAIASDLESSTMPPPICVDSETNEGSEDAFSSPFLKSAMPMDWGNTSDGTAEDWQSAGGGQSDGEGEGKARRTTSDFPSPASVEQDTAFRRPLVDSIIVTASVEEPPFKHAPGNMP